MHKTIFFYELDKPYGCFSNFSPHWMVLEGQWWQSVEHYFQAHKCVEKSSQDLIRQAATPKQAAELGRDRTLPLRPDWEQIKEEVMRRAVLCKFESYAQLRAILLATGDREIVENSSYDYYWGCGKDGNGKNRLGQILMEVRELLRKREAPKTCSHQAVGALIRNAEDGVLLFQRNTPPPGFAGPAGHCEPGESAEDALIKEVREEVGLQVIEHKLMKEFFDPHPCRRESDQPEGHHWRFYEVQAEGELRTNDREVVPLSARYVSPQELVEIAAHTEEGTTNADGFDWPWFRLFQWLGMLKNS